MFARFKQLQTHSFSDIADKRQKWNAGEIHVHIY